MAEILNKKAPPPEPFKVGKADIKVKALRPVLLGHHSGKDTPVRVDKGEIGFVDENELKLHAGILEKTLALLLFIGILFASEKSVQAQSYSANIALTQTNLNGTNAFYSTNANVATGNIAGGVMTTNGVAAAYTNSSVCTVVGLTRYDQCAVMLTWQVASGGSPSTNQLFIYPSDDGVNVDTNHPIVNVGCACSVGTNGLFCTNVSNALLGSHGYLGFGLGNQTGGVVITNPVIQVFVKPQRSG